MSSNDRLPNERPDANSAPGRISELLTLATEQMDVDTAESLRRSRQTALARQMVDVRRFSIVAGNGMHLPVPHFARHWAAILLIATAVVGAGYWQHLRNHEMMAHLDVAILTDDIPMEIFVDR